MYLGRAMIHPQGFSTTRRSSSRRAAAASSVLDTRAPVLRRQQPGRDHGRLADRARAGLQPRRARRAGHELLDAPAPQRRLRHVRAGPLRELPERARAAADPVADPDAVGPRRGERLRAPHDAATRRRTRRRTRCCCTRPSATTRWPTSPPRSRRARSARRVRAARARSGPPQRREPVLRDPGDSRPTRSTARRWSCWDSGSADARRPNNTPPRAGTDPHSHPRNSPAARLQKSEFLKLGGRVVERVRRRAVLRERLHG